MSVEPSYWEPDFQFLSHLALYHFDKMVKADLDIYFVDQCAIDNSSPKDHPSYRDLRDSDLVWTGFHTLIQLPVNTTLLTDFDTGEEFHHYGGKNNTDLDEIKRYTELHQIFRDDWCMRNLHIHDEFSGPTFIIVKKSYVSGLSDKDCGEYETVESVERDVAEYQAKAAAG